MEVASLVLSIIAVLGSFLTYLNHDRRLKKQEELINDFEIEKRRSEENEQKKAHIKGNIIPYAKGHRKLMILNAGKATAYNIRTEILSDTKGIFYSEIEPYEMLNPQDNFENSMHLAYGHLPTLKVKYIWDDEFEKNREFLQVLDLK
jgi:hypothetical protein